MQNHGILFRIMEQTMADHGNLVGHGEHGRSWQLMNIVENHGTSWRIMQQLGVSLQIMAGNVEDHGKSWNEMRGSWGIMKDSES